MSDAEELENQGFKVKDRRRFNPDGSPIEGAEDAAEPVPAAAAEEKVVPPPREIPVDFSSLILSIAAGAHSGLGLAPHPMTGKLEKNLSQAKYNIDLLGLLQDKTKGNLSPEEAQLIEAILYDLRMRYVEAQTSS